MSNNPAWKQFERRIAKDLSTQRTPLSGGNSRITRADTLHPTLFVECKWRSRSSLFTRFHDVEAQAKEESKTPILVTHLKHHPGSLATVRWRTLLELLEAAGKLTPSTQEE